MVGVESRSAFLSLRGYDSPPGYAKMSPRALYANIGP